MDDRGGNGTVMHGSDAAEVANVHEAGAGEVEDVVGEKAMRIKLTPPRMYVQALIDIYVGLTYTDK